MNLERATVPSPDPFRDCPCLFARHGSIRVSSRLARVIATYRSRRSSSIAAADSALDGGDAAFDNIQYEHRTPLAPLATVNRGKREKVVVLRLTATAVALLRWRIERQVGEKLTARLEGARHHNELLEISKAVAVIFKLRVADRPIPCQNGIKLSRSFDLTTAQAPDEWTRTTNTHTLDVVIGSRGSVCAVTAALTISTPTHLSNARTLACRLLQHPAIFYRGGKTGRNNGTTRPTTSPALAMGHVEVWGGAPASGN